MKNSTLYYSVGALLYCPANNTGIVSSISQEKFGSSYSLALCLEDTIRDDCVAEAEGCLVHSLGSLYCLRQKHTFFLPKIFVRIRSAVQICGLMDRLGEAAQLVTGFIIPKFSLENADQYIQSILLANEKAKRPVYMMPIYESPSIIHLAHRYDILYSLKGKLDQIEELVLNIRVGGNDLCHQFGFRRHSNESIHKLAPVARIFSDIITVYGMDYVVSGPVFEYYSGESWDTGMRQELSDDRLCGFVGKTVIHPRQIALVNAAYRVTKRDLADAKAILNWDKDTPSLVSGNVAGERMNECKTHSNWALRTLLLAEAFGTA